MPFYHFSLFLPHPLENLSLPICNKFSSLLLLDGAAPVCVVPHCDGVQCGSAVGGGHLLSNWLLRLPSSGQRKPWHIQKRGVMEELTKKNNDDHEEQ